MNKEDFFIKQIQNSKYNGDDGAFIDGYVYSMDAFFEDVHFKKEWIKEGNISLKQIAYKSMLVNISDAIAMNAKPKYALITIAIPKTYTQYELKELANGFKKAAHDFGFEIIGGDTIENHKLDISITIISKTENPIYRKDVKIGDFICYTGKLGDSKKGLEALLKGQKIKKNSKFIKPKLKADFFYEASKFINSSMDISDGLFLDLEKLSKASKIGFDFFKEIKEEVGTSGEEYEILFSVSQKNLKKIEDIAKKYKVKLNYFAKAVKGSYKSSFPNHHFKN
ncbi:Thiamine-monophosphate kinase [Aliarcobacter thereius]|uniref:Thiamine-monophosphate kinase n=2 Tax=Aliarcobacter thereius TaxID=544718 RepID=A0A1C0B653_9BACT|nr:thiamine-phosphate kinase [Aliarcobacter thereius]OCL86309.1 Thiamine-monophosphate kinase [Aliarcobacter thereius]OCL96407.1 Thiamine-monophosphate kinase [Aliarcobacter thereius LMG 24486]OCL98632.1 Thiamine-monophosphate kinase [Aliarcobacter thereius]QBF15632.1 thiamine monophosphate kinase [Aliarcobacter thereius LMG 24486]TLS92581.1 thiamine-phosphate kinase [Aliarcobacter thereius]